jgi:hypothetical protein
VVEMKVFEKKENSSIIYSEQKMPMMMSNRDNLCLFERVKQQDGRLLFIVQSIKRDDLVPEKEGVIRMDFYKASMAE